jgi:hypothetical protein
LQVRFKLSSSVHAEQELEKLPLLTKHVSFTSYRQENEMELLTEPRILNFHPG